MENVEKLTHVTPKIITYERRLRWWNSAEKGTAYSNGGGWYVSKEQAKVDEKKQ
jgi:hypothetical protein